MKRKKKITFITILLLVLMPFPGKTANSSPGIYVEELPYGLPSITPVATAVAGFLGQTEKGPVEPQLITSYGGFEDTFGSNPGNRYYLPDAVRGFFENGGKQLYVARIVPKGVKLLKTKLNQFPRDLPIPLLSDYIGNGDEDTGPLTGLKALAQIDEITILYSPEAQGISGLCQAMVDQCEDLKDRIVIMESALSDTDPKPFDEVQSSYAAYYTPWLKITDAAGKSRFVPPGGFIAGSYARTDIEKGVHKVPSNIQLMGVIGLERTIGATEQSNFFLDKVNPIVLKAGRGIMVNSARTLSADQEYTYVNLRRYVNYLDESISESLGYLSMESWTPALGSKVQSSVENFLEEEWRKGALLGSRQEDAFFVQVTLDPAVTEDVEEHTICIEAGVALIKPAEFHIVKASIAAG